MLSYTLLDDVCNVLQTWRKLFRPVVAESNVVGDITLVACDIQSFLEFCSCLIEFGLFEQHATLGNNCFGGVDWLLLNERFGSSDLFKLILDADLQLQNFIFKVSAFDLLQNFECVLIHASFVKSLCMIQLIRVPCVAVAEEF